VMERYTSLKLAGLRKFSLIEFKAGRIYEILY
jgi:hypothetical protein